MRNINLYRVVLPPVNGPLYFWRPGKALYFLRTLSNPSMPAFKVSSCEHKVSIHNTTISPGNNSPDANIPSDHS
jgi:hypothetical protein